WPPQIDFRSPQAFGAGEDIAALDAQVGAQGGQPLQMQIHRPIADVAPARQRNARASTAGQERTQNANPGSHPANQLVVGQAWPGIDDLQFERGDLRPSRVASFSDTEW